MEQQEQQTENPIIYATAIIEMIKQPIIDGDLSRLTILEQELLTYYIEEFEKTLKPKKENNETWQNHR